MNGFDPCNIPGQFPSQQQQQQRHSNEGTHSVSLTGSQWLLSTPKKNHGNTKKITTPSSSSFKFTQTNGRSLYPTLVPSSSPDSGDCSMRKQDSSFEEGVSNRSYCNKENESFVEELDHLQKKLFSSTLTTNVMNEFNDRYKQVRRESIANIQRLNKTTSNDELTKRNSWRLSGKRHSAHFNRMESINTHYAALRAKREDHKNETSTPQRHIIKSSPRVSRIKIKSGDKRGVLEGLSNASKRFRTLKGSFKEVVDSPTKEQAEKQHLKEVHLRQFRKNIPTGGNKNQGTRFRSLCTHALSSTDHSSRLPSYLMPTKASLQRMKSNKEIFRQDSKLRSPLYHSRLSSSRASSNLHSLLAPPKNNPTIPKFAHSDHHNGRREPSRLPRIPKSRTVSSIPRLAKPEQRTRMHRSPTSTTLSRQAWRY